MGCSPLFFYSFFGFIKVAGSLLHQPDYRPAPLCCFLTRLLPKRSFMTTVNMTNVNTVSLYIAICDPLFFF